MIAAFGWKVPFYENRKVAKIRASIEPNVINSIREHNRFDLELYDFAKKLFEENLRIMHKAWQENYDRFKAGGKDPPEYYQVRGQYEEFRGERFRALNEVLEAERNLRSILGLSVCRTLRSDSLTKMLSSKLIIVRPS